MVSRIFEYCSHVLTRLFRAILPLTWSENTQNLLLTPPRTVPDLDTTYCKCECTEVNHSVVVSTLTWLILSGGLSVLITMALDGFQMQGSLTDYSFTRGARSSKFLASMKILQIVFGFGDFMLRQSREDGSDTMHIVTFSGCI